MKTLQKLNRDILKLALPSILAGVTVPLVGLVDTAIAGHLGASSHIAAIAVGSMLFDWLYWNMGFLRMGTAGFTAQAFGRKDFRATTRTLLQGLCTAWAISLLILLIQRPYANLFFRITPTSPETESLARCYFFICIWSEPAALTLFTIKGWFIGMQNTWCPMVVDLVVNGVNIALSYILAIPCGLGIQGIAWGTVIAQYSGLLCAGILLWLRFRKYREFTYWKDALIWEDYRHFFSVNANLFLRTLGMLLVYSGITILAGLYGDTPQAVSSIMTKMLLLYSYFIDGFAYAGEAMSGRYIGAHDEPTLRRAVRCLFVWCAAVSVLATLVYMLFDEGMLRVLTTVSEVFEAARPCLFWLYLMPLCSSAAFTWDGIFIGATASKALRDSMLWSVLAFYLCYFALAPYWGFQAIWAGYTLHVIVRSVAMTLYAPKQVFALVD